MSRNSRVPRKDLVLLRKLRNIGDGSFVPSSLLEDGNTILEKADKIKGFLQKQKKRTDHVSAKTEWLLAQQELQEERLQLEHEVGQQLQQLAEGLGGELPEVVDALAAYQAVNNECRLQQQELREQVLGLSQVSSSLRAYGMGAFSSEAQALKQQMAALGEDLQLALGDLQRQYEQLSQEARDEWPSALMAGAHPGNISHVHQQQQQQAKRASSSGEAGGPGGAVAAADYGEAAAGGAYDSAVDDADLADTLAKYPMASEDVKDRIRQVFVALQSKFLEKYETWRVEAEMSGVAGMSSTGGWPSDAHSQFLRLRERYFKELGPKARGGREAVMRKISLLLPGRSVQQLMQHDDWLVQYKIVMRKRRDILEGWSRERRLFLQDSEMFLAESAALQQARALQAAERAAHEVARAEVAERYSAIQQEAAARAEVEAAERAERERFEAEAAAQEAARQREEQAQRKALVALYHEQLEERRREEEAEAERAAAEAAAEASERAVYNRQRVDWRHAETLWKQDKTKEAAERAASEARLREERLAQLRALVAPQVEADPDRVMQPTLASLGVEDLPEEAGPFKPVHGYTTEQMYRDQRFKVMEALQRAGLHNTDAGRHAIAMAHTFKPTRPDNLTAQQRGF